MRVFDTRGQALDLDEVAADGSVKAGEFHLLPEEVLLFSQDKEGYAVAQEDGRTVGELDAGCASAREIAELWTYVETRLRKSARAEAA